MTQAGRDQHPSHSDLQPSLWLDHDVSLRRNRRLQPLEELHGFRVIGGIAELVVPLLQSVPVRPDALRQDLVDQRQQRAVRTAQGDRKSTRLNSSHANNSYAVFCLKKKNTG